jgi:hypothetical protein
MADGDNGKLVALMIINLQNHVRPGMALYIFSP